MTGFALDSSRIEVLLCDADGNLFPSEEPAFVPSTRLINRFLAQAGVEQRFGPEQLRLATTGKNFRTTLTDIARRHGIEIAPQELERWVAAERGDVTSYLRETLRPDPWLRESLLALAGSFRLAAVSSSAAVRLDACFEATGLDDLFPPEVRFSAEDSLEEPRSKPDPAIYELAASCLEIEPAAGLAIEDSVPGVQSAVAAGHPVVGNVVFVNPGERTDRAQALLEAGAAGVVASWGELARILLGSRMGVRAGQAHRVNRMDRVVYNSFNGRFSDNPRGIYEELARRGLELEHVWTTRSTEPDDFPAEVVTSVPGTEEHRRLVDGARWIVANVEMRDELRKRDGQTFLQTWHGTPLKRIGYDNRWVHANPAAFERDVMEYERWDYLISANPLSTRVFRDEDAFRGFAGEIIETGYPRNDALNAADREEVRARVRSELGIEDGRTVVLYAPTWRDNLLHEQGPDAFALKLDLDELAGRLGEDHTFLLADPLPRRGEGRGGGGRGGHQRLRLHRRPRALPGGGRPDHRLLVGDVRLRDHRQADALLHLRPRVLPGRDARLLLRLRGRGAGAALPDHRRGDRGARRARPLARALRRSLRGVRRALLLARGRPRGGARRRPGLRGGGPMSAAASTRVVVLAAGRGSRLGSTGAETPKWLLEVGGRTIAERQLEAAEMARRETGGAVGPVHVVTGHAEEEIRRFLADGPATG